MKKIVIDLDETITEKSDLPYPEKIPNEQVVAKLIQYKKAGFEIAIHTARNMRTHGGNVGLICAKTLPVIHAWLLKNNIPFDEIFIGKPWCGEGGFYVDDKAIRPSEFTDLEYHEIQSMINRS